MASSGNCSKASQVRRPVVVAMVLVRRSNSSSYCTSALQRRSAPLLDTRGSVAIKSRFGTVGVQRSRIESRLPARVPAPHKNKRAPDGRASMQNALTGLVQQARITWGILGRSLLVTARIGQGSDWSGLNLKPHAHAWGWGARTVTWGSRSRRWTLFPPRMRPRCGRDSAGQCAGRWPIPCRFRNTRSRCGGV